MITNAIEVHEMIEKNAKESSQEKRQIEKIDVGQAIRQGDIYMIRVADSGITEIPLVNGTKMVVNTDANKRGAKLDTRQLAPGETKGSRHIIAEGPSIYKSGAGLPTAWGGVLQTELVGPLVVSNDRFELTHPEHAHFSLPAGTYQVMYQGDWQGQMERARD
jgi:hypothetical protein